MSVLEEDRHATFSWRGRRDLAMGLYTHMSGLGRVLNAAGYGDTSLLQQDTDPEEKESGVQITFIWIGPQQRLYNVAALLNALRQMMNALQDSGIAQVTTGNRPPDVSASAEEQTTGAPADAG